MTRRGIVELAKQYGVASLTKDADNTSAIADILTSLGIDVEPF